MRILIVCLGNICRSPAAEGVARVRLPEIQVGSAGTSDWHRGDPPYAPMQLAARERGYDISMLRARGFDAKDFEAFDLILGMDRQNMEDIERLRPTGVETPTRLFTSFAEGLPHDVPDPYYTRDFDGALRLIEEATEGLAKWLAKTPS